MSLRGITKTSGSHQALRGVYLDVYGDECIGLIGDNAAGKSTLSKIIAGTLVPGAGRIRLRGERVTFQSPAEARARRIEMVYQDLSLCDHIDWSATCFSAANWQRGRSWTRNG